MKKICSRCYEPVSEPFVTHMDPICSHFTDYKCFPDCVDYKHLIPKCVNCSGELDEIIQPSTYKGIDYIYDDNVEIKRDPNLTRILQLKIPICQLMKERGCHLQKLLSMGATIYDFTDNGYTWKELQTFKELSEKNDKRCFALLALGCDANYYRDNTKVIHWKKDVFKSSRQFVEFFDLHMGGEGLVAGSDEEFWFVRDFLNMGIKLGVLQKHAGIKTIDQMKLLRPGDLSKEKLRKFGMPEKYL